MLYQDISGQLYYHLAQFLSTQLEFGYDYSLAIRYHYETCRAKVIHASRGFVQKFSFGVEVGVALYVCHISYTLDDSY